MKQVHDAKQRRIALNGGTAVALALAVGVAMDNPALGIGIMVALIGLFGVVRNAC